MRKNKQEPPIKSLVLELLSIESTTDRQALLDERCGADESLRKQVERFIVCEDRLDDFLDVAAQGHAETVQNLQQINPLIGAKVGPYQLREKLGEGGMGTVYVAEQRRPFRRKVALKIVKEGMDTPQILARFEAERQALALMNHPNIAKVLDAGATDSGRPFFVMELVQGLSITEYCDEKKLDTRQRAEILIRVCQAVQHAHQKGVIHRDLKPSNILVSTIDGAAVPKVIDFGVAKATGQKLSDQTVYTQFEQLVGTPMYMSPEQVEMGVVDVDTRSDVYSLGVVAYEVFTGSAPFDRDVFRQASFAEIQRVIREEEPPRPSQYVSTLKAELGSTISARRATDPRQLCHTLRGELDWLIMKALEKDRNRRYESPSAMANDMARYLNDEPIDAGPPSSLYRIRKFTKRHRVTVATATAISIAILVGGAVAAWQFQEANLQRNLAIAAQEKSEKEADRAKEQSRITEAVSQFLNENLLSQANPDNQPDPNIRLLTVVDRAANQLDNQLSDAPTVEAAIRYALADTYESLGRFKEAVAHAKRSLEIRRTNHQGAHPDILRSEIQLAWLDRQLGKPLKCRQGLENLLKEMRRPSDENRVLLLKAKGLLACCLIDLGKLADSERLLREVISKGKLSESSAEQALLAQENLGTCLSRAGRFDEAETLLRESERRLRQSKGKEHPSTLRTMANLAVVLSELGDNQKASKINEKVLELRRKLLGPDHPDTITSMQNLASVYAETNRPAEAKELRDRALDICRNNLGEDHPQTLAIQINRAISLQGAGRYSDAEQEYERILELAEGALGRDHPITLKAELGLARTLGQMQRFEEAESLLISTRSVLEELYGEQHSETITAMSNLAGLNRSRAMNKKALLQYQKILELQTENWGEEHQKTISTMNVIAGILGDVGKAAEGIEFYRRALALAEASLPKDDTLTISIIGNLGHALLQEKQLAEAKELLVTAFESKTRILGKEHPRTLNSKGNVALLFSAEGDYEKSLELLHECVEASSRVLSPKHPNTLGALTDLVKILLDAKKYEEAVEHGEKLVEALAELPGKDHPAYPNALNDLGRAFFGLSRFADAGVAFRDAFAGNLAVLGETHPNTLLYGKNLVLALKQQEKFREASSTLRELLDLSVREEDQQMSTRLVLRDDLASCLQSAASQSEWKLEDVAAWESTVRENLLLKLDALPLDYGGIESSRKDLRLVLMRRAEQLVLTEQFEKALEVLSEITELSPDRKQAESLVGLQVYLDKQNAAASFSQQLWERAQAETGNASPKSRWIVDALLSPHHGIDTKQAIKFMEAVVDAETGHMQRLALGLAHYRNGDFETASQTIETDTAGSAKKWLGPLMCFFSAMAHHRNRDTERALELFDLGVVRMNQLAPTPSTGSELKKWEPLRWTLWCLYQGLKREAAEVLDIQIKNMPDASATGKEKGAGLNSAKES